MHMGITADAYNHYDTVLCAGPHQRRELRELEKYYHLKEKRLIDCGYPLIDELIANYEAMEHTENAVKKILIAPSWQDGNILEGPIHPMLESLLGKGYDITVRPHPEFIKRYPAKMHKLMEQYQDRFGEDFRIETDFSSNVTIFTADLVVTDWSGISVEFSYATKKPCLFINTPMKILNPEYDKLPCVPLELSIRDRIGRSLNEDQLEDTEKTVRYLLDHADDYRQAILETMQENLYNIGHSAEAGARYIIGAVERQEAKAAASADSL